MPKKNEETKTEEAKVKQNPVGFKQNTINDNLKDIDKVIKKHKVDNQSFVSIDVNVPLGNGMYNTITFGTTKQITKKTDLLQFQKEQLFDLLESYVMVVEDILPELIVPKKEE